MKKFFIGMSLLLVAATLIAKNVEEINGFDWHIWSVGQKIGYVQGFYSGYSSIWERLFLEMENDGGIGQQEEKQLEQYFYIPLTVETAIERIDSFYSDYDNREVWLYRVLMYIAGKDYWNSGQFQENQQSELPQDSNS